MLIQQARRLRVENKLRQLIRSFDILDGEKSTLDFPKKSDFFQPYQESPC